MAQYNFGTGSIAGRRTDISVPTPVIFGVVKDLSLDFTRTIKELVGQSQVPVALGPGELKLAGKLSFAKLDFNVFNDMFFGQTGSAAGTTQMTPLPGVAAAVPGSISYVVTPTVPNSGTFAQDQGVFYAATGTPLTRVAPGSEATGKYSCVDATGVYTFAAGDANANLLFMFTYTTATGGTTITMSNQLMGSAPTFELTYQGGFSQFGTSKILNIQLLSVMAEKFMMPMKNSDFTEMGLDFKMQANPAGNFLTLSVTDA